MNTELKDRGCLQHHIKGNYKEIALTYDPHPGVKRDCLLCWTVVRVVSYWRSDGILSGAVGRGAPVAIKVRLLGPSSSRGGPPCINVVMTIFVTI